MSHPVAFTVPLPPVPLRRNSETEIKGYRSALKREYQEQVWCAGHVAKNQHAMRYGSPMIPSLGWEWQRATVHYTWRSTRQTDEDNIIASMKPALDVLKSTGPRPLGIIVDDAGAVVSATWEKASRKSDERVEIVIEQIEVWPATGRFGEVCQG